VLRRFARGVPPGQAVEETGIYEASQPALRRFAMSGSIGPAAAIRAD